MAFLSGTKLIKHLIIEQPMICLRRNLRNGMCLPITLASHKLWHKQHPTQPPFDKSSTWRWQKTVMLWRSTMSSLILNSFVCPWPIFIRVSPLMGLNLAPNSSCIIILSHGRVIDKKKPLHRCFTLSVQMRNSLSRPIFCPPPKNPSLFLFRFGLVSAVRRGFLSISWDDGARNGFQKCHLLQNRLAWRVRKRPTDTQLTTDSFSFGKIIKNRGETEDQLLVVQSKENLGVEHVVFWYEFFTVSLLLLKDNRRWEWKHSWAYQMSYWPWQ